MIFEYHREEVCRRLHTMPYGRSQDDFDAARKLFDQHVTGSKNGMSEEFCCDFDNVARGEYPSNTKTNKEAIERLCKIVSRFRSGMIYEDTNQETILEGLQMYLENVEDLDYSNIKLLCKAIARVMRLGQWGLANLNPGDFRIDLADDNVVGWMEVVREAYSFIKWAASGIVISIRHWDDSKIKTLIGLIRETYIDPQSVEGCVAKLVLDTAEKCEKRHAVVFMISTALALTSMQFATPEWVLKEVEC